MKRYILGRMHAAEISTSNNLLRGVAIVTKSGSQSCSMALLVCYGFAVLSLGCGGNSYGPTGKVGGRLTLAGKPLAPGHAVSFMQMEKGFLAFGLTDADGDFMLNSWNNGAMPVGKYKVMIAPPPPGPHDPNQMTAEDRFEKPELVEPAGKAEFPKKYRDTTTSGLEFEIQEGMNMFPIDLTP